MVTCKRLWHWHTGENQQYLFDGFFMHTKLTCTVHENLMILALEEGSQLLRMKVYGQRLGLTLP